MKKTKTDSTLAVLLWTFVLSLFALSGYAQENAARRTISGKVTGKLNDEPIVGASVTVKGTSRMVSTNSTGDFTIEATQGETLVFSSIGFASKEVKINNNIKREKVIRNQSSRKLYVWLLCRSSEGLMGTGVE